MSNNPIRRGPSHSVILRRRDDLLRLTFDFYNVRLDVPGGLLHPLDASQPCRVIVRFPPQSLFEEAVKHVEDDDGNDQTPVPLVGSLRARLAGPSRLGFVIPASQFPLPYTAEALLSWTGWEHTVPLGARPAVGDPPLIGAANLPPGYPLLFYRPTAPGLFETAIEAPWWLQIAPNRTSHWTHRIAPGEKPPPPHAPNVRNQSRFELWHTRVTSRPTLVNVPIAVDEPGSGVGPSNQPFLGTATDGPTNNRVIRAVWSPDPQFEQILTDPGQAHAGEPPVPFVAAMNQKQRLEIVRLTTDYYLEHFFGQPGRPAVRPVVVDRLELSTLGASLALVGGWPGTPETDLLNWRHRSSLARDNFVRVVGRGYLIPFGHRCIKIEVTERRFMGTGATRVAPLVRREFLVVTQPLLDYAGADGQHQINQGRSFPFRSVRMRTIVTPPINLDGFSPIQTGNCFFPILTGSGADLLWHATAVDWDGVAHDLVMPMAFVAGTVAENPSLATGMPVVRAAWNALNDPDHPERGWAPLQGRRVAYAQALTGRPGSTANETKRMRLRLDGVQGVSASSTGARLFFPALELAEVRLDGVEGLTANQIGHLEIKYEPTYETHGFVAAQNPGGVYAQFSAPPTLGFSRDPAQADQSGKGADKSGGLITPDLVISGLSRSLGVAAGELENVKQGSFDAAAFFKGTSPKLLGGILLQQIIKPVSLTANQPAPPAAMQISSVRDGDVMETRIRWEPELKPDEPANIFQPGTLRLDALMRTPLGGGKGTSLVEGEIKDFAIQVPGGSSALLTISFHRLGFTSVDGKKPDVDVSVKNVSFGGELAWIEKLRSYLNFGGGSGPEIKLLPDRIEAGIGVSLPNITLGVFSLKNIAFGAAFEIPLTGEPARVRFGLSSRENPFRLTVFCIGGGGWVVLGFGVDGFEMLEIGFEGGAELSVDFGPASGSISMMFGIVLILTQSGGTDTASFEGYFGIHGELSVAIVSVSVGLELSLKYQVKTKNNKTVKTMYGKGKLYIELPPLAPVPSFSVTIEKSFKSEQADPTFQDQMRPLPNNPDQSEDWTGYCHAFAPAGA